MIQHVVCFRLRAESLLQRWQEVSAPLEEIGTVHNFRAVPLLDQSRFHCALYMEFADERALEYYQKHPLHQKYVQQSVPPLMEEKLVVDLVAENAAQDSSTE